MKNNFDLKRIINTEINNLKKNYLYTDSFLDGNLYYSDVKLKLVVNSNYISKRRIRLLNRLGYSLVGREVIKLVPNSREYILSEVSKGNLSVRMKEPVYGYIFIKNLNTRYL